MIELKKITLLSDDMKECIALDIAPEKKDFVFSNAVMLADSYDFDLRGRILDCRAIYVEGKMVGLITYNYYVDNPFFKKTCYRIRPFMIDKNHTGKGYEKAALQKLLEEIKTQPHGEATAIFAHYDPTEKDMSELYRSVGFVETDLIWEAQTPMTTVLLSL